MFVMGLVGLMGNGVFVERLCICVELCRGSFSQRASEKEKENGHRNLVFTYLFFCVLDEGGRVLS